MLTKNTKELKLRGAAHARADHIKQGTYGRGWTNGKTVFEGCAVGCLSTPHRQAALVKFLKEHLSSFAFDPEENPDGDTWELHLSDNRQREMLEEEFGLNSELIKLTEALFEAQPTHGAAINFVRDFSAAVPEGVNIEDEDCERFAESFKLSLWREWNEVEEDITDSGNVEGITTSYLDWLRNFAAQPAPA